MNVYKEFLKKEATEILSHKKTLLLLVGFMLYPAFINVLEKDVSLPIEQIIPLFFLFSVCFPSDFIYTIMNEEIENKTFEILYISKLNRMEILLSKITIPIFIGLVNMVLSLFLNNLLLALFKPVTGYYGMVSLKNILFFILSSIFTSLSAYSIFNIVRSKINKQLYTLSIAIELIFLSILFRLISINNIWLFILFLLNLFLFVVNIYVVKKYDYFENRTRKNDIKGNKYKQVLLKNAYKHVMSTGKLVCLIWVELICLLVCKYYFQNAFMLSIVSFVLLSIMNCNLFVFRKQIIDRENKINEILLTITNRKTRLLFYDICIPLLMNTIMALIILFDSFSVLRFMIVELHILNCLMIFYCAGAKVDLKFQKQIHAILTTILMVISIYFLGNANIVFLFIELLVFVIMTIYLYG